MSRNIRTSAERVASLALAARHYRPMSIDGDTDNVARRCLREALAKNDPKARTADTVCEDIGVNRLGE